MFFNWVILPNVLPFVNVSSTNVAITEKLQQIQTELFHFCAPWDVTIYVGIHKQLLPTEPALQVLYTQKKFSLIKQLSLGFEQSVLIAHSNKHIINYFIIQLIFRTFFVAGF